MASIPLAPGDHPSLAFPPAQTGIARLYGNNALRRLQAAHVCIVGIGGIGSWIVEALARTGIGAFTLIDPDDICATNINRQIHAVEQTVGRNKAELMARRIAGINPIASVHCERVFLTAANVSQLLAPPFDFVIDAIDSVNHKCLIIDECRRLRKAVITLGGAGGRWDPTQIALADLKDSFNDALLQRVRKQLRQKFGFPRQRRQKFHVPCVFSRELPKYPQSDGSVCTLREPGSGLRLDCETGYGTATPIVGVMAFFAASHVINRLAAENSEESQPSASTIASSSSLETRGNVSENVVP